MCCPHGITGYGSTESGIMFIGIAPGKDEALRTKRPLTGPSGKLLDAVLETHGIKRDDVYTTNLICYWKDAPDRSDIQVCSSRLSREIQLVNPKIIVLLGKIACESMLNIPFSKARGAVIPRNGITYLVSNHPAAALHPDNKEQQIEAAYNLVRDLGKLPRILNNEYQFIEPTYTIINDVHHAQTLLDSLPVNTPVTIDIETKYDKEIDRSHPFSDEIRCVGIGWSDTHCYVLIGNALSETLIWPDREYTYHNGGGFDIQQIRKHLGVWLPVVHDSMLEHYCCDERSVRGLHKLKPMLRELVGSDFYEEEEHQNLDSLILYNTKDVCGTARVERYVRDWMVREQTDTVFNNLLRPASEMLARSQYHGIYINPKHVGEIEVKFGTEYMKLTLELKKLATSLGFPDLNLRSPIQLKAMLHAQGYPVPNTTKYTLQDLAEADNIFIQKLLRYRTLERLITVYLHLVLEQVKYDGRVHPHALLIGTVTGRLVYKDPPMQTLPKPKTVKDLGVIRKIFSATDQDHVLIEVDYAQIEAWLGAYFSKDDILLSDLQSDDWHDTTTRDVFKVTEESCTPHEWDFYRDAGKHLNYGCMYGEGPDGLTRKPPIGMGCDINTARIYHQRWYNRYRVFGKYQQEQQRKAREDAEIVTPFGRKRRFPIIVNDHQLRQAINYEIQSTASDYTLSSAIKLWPQLERLDTYLLFIEHDALYYEAPRQNLQEVVSIIKQVMESPPLLGLPSIKTAELVGDNLAELVGYKA